MKGKYTHNCKMLVCVYIAESARTNALRTSSELISTAIYHRFATWTAITAKISENSWRQNSNYNKGRGAPGGCWLLFGFSAAKPVQLANQSAPYLITSKLTVKGIAHVQKTSSVDWSQELGGSCVNHDKGNRYLFTWKISKEGRHIVTTWHDKLSRVQRTPMVLISELSIHEISLATHPLRTLRYC